jgi:hypothetical protein
VRACTSAAGGGLPTFGLDLGVVLLRHPAVQVFLPVHDPTAEPEAVWTDSKVSPVAERRDGRAECRRRLKTDPLATVEN